MPFAENLIAFTLAATLLTLTPGIDTALVLRTAAVEGRRQAFRAALGINTGCLIWGAAVAFGLGRCWRCPSSATTCSSIAVRPIWPGSG